MKTDTELLDWLNKNGRRVGHAIGYRGDSDTWWYVGRDGDHREASDLRDAIAKAQAECASPNTLLCDPVEDKKS